MAGLFGFPLETRAGREPVRDVSRLAIRCQSFFFQAKDGTRDLIVTGVQTCALPISPRRSSGAVVPVLIGVLAVMGVAGAFGVFAVGAWATGRGPSAEPLTQTYTSKDRRTPKYQDRKSVV